MGEHAGVRRAPCDEDACAELGGSAAKPAPPRAVQRAVGTWRRVGRAPCRWRGGDRSSSSDDDAGAHARHMRRRTSGSCQLTLPPRPISRVSSASLPSLAASYTASPIESLIASAAALSAAALSAAALSAAALSAAALSAAALSDALFNSDESKWPIFCLVRKTDTPSQPNLFV